MNAQFWMREMTNPAAGAIIALWTLLIIALGVLARRAYGKKFIKVRAKVTGMDSQLSRNHRTGGRIEVFRPEYTYPWKGWDRVITERVYSSWLRYEIGDELDLYINASDPSDFRYHGFSGAPFFAVWLAGVLALAYFRWA